MVLSSFGATIVSVFLPDKNGNVEDCVLGFDTMAEYDRDGGLNPYFGCTVGRFANRIDNAQFTLDGQTTNLDATNGKATLHGGLQGWHRRIWDSNIIENGV